MLCRPDHLAKVATSGIELHNLVAVTLTKDCPITSSAAIKLILQAQ